MSVIDSEKLSHILAEYAGITDQEAAGFISSFTSVVTSHVKQGEEVEIQGLGKFVLIDTQQTDMRRVALIVSDSMKDEVNSPFSFFEPFVISSGNAQTEDAAEVETPVVPLETAEVSVETAEVSETEQMTAEEQQLTEEAESEEPQQTEETENKPKKKSKMDENGNYSKTETTVLVSLLVFLILVIGYLSYLIFFDNDDDYFKVPSKEKTEKVISEEPKKDVEDAPAEAVADTIVAEEAVKEEKKEEPVAPAVEEPRKEEAKPVQTPAPKAEPKAVQPMKAEPTPVQQQVKQEPVPQKHVVPETTPAPKPEPKTLPKAEPKLVSTDATSHRMKDSAGNLVVVTVKPGDRLTLIALEHFGMKDFWPYIYDVNSDKLKSPSNVQAGMKLYLPDPAYFKIDANDAASVSNARLRARTLLNAK